LPSLDWAEADVPVVRALLNELQLIPSYWW
jgi:hypothetical protein